MFTPESEWYPHSDEFMRNELALSLTDMSTSRPVLTMDTHIVVGVSLEMDELLSNISNVYSEDLFHANLNENLSIPTKKPGLSCQGLLQRDEPTLQKKNCASYGA